jgi:uncharacterized protein YccT (UPF0319 family)
MSKVIIILLMTLAFNVHASVLTIPDNIIVLSVNGEEQVNSFFAKEIQLTLEQGEHVLVLKYQDIFEGWDDHTKVTSKPFIALFTLSKTQLQNSTLIMKTIVLEELAQAKRFSKNPHVVISTAQGKEIKVFNQSLIAFNAQLRFSQLTNSNPNSNDEGEKMTGVATVENIKLVNADICTSNQGHISELSRLARLKCLWHASSQMEQEAFVYFILSDQQQRLNQTNIEK